MKKITLVLLSALLTGTLATTSAMAAFQGPAATSQVVTVAQALEGKDRQHVTLTGYIIAEYGDEEYQFKDDTGEIRIELDDDDWNGVNATPETKVTIYGKIDIYRERIEVDVKSIRLAQ